MPKPPNSLIQVVKVLSPSGATPALVLHVGKEQRLIQVSVQVALDLAKDLTDTAKECSS